MPSLPCERRNGIVLHVNAAAIAPSAASRDVPRLPHILPRKLETCESRVLSLSKIEDRVAATSGPIRVQQAGQRVALSSNKGPRTGCQYRSVPISYIGQRLCHGRGRGSIDVQWHTILLDSW